MDLIECYDTTGPVLDTPVADEDLSTFLVETSYGQLRDQTCTEVRKEWNRLREVEKLEKSRPENQHVTIRLDTKERKLYRNDIVIDSWNPHPF